MTIDDYLASMQTDVHGREMRADILGALTLLKGTVDDAADAAATMGMSDGLKTALLQCFSHAAWASAEGQSYYNALEAALFPPPGLASITAVYHQSGTVYVTASLESLRPDLTVTAYYDDATSGTVTAYTLSGTLTVGTSTVTVSYGDKTATFTVTVTAVPTYTITANLTGTTLSNSATEVVQGGLYESSVTMSAGYENLTVTVKMGGTDVTASVYADGRIVIDAVTGNVVITATATRITYTEIYKLANTPVTANADLYADTGLVFGSSSAGGVTKAWTILGDIETTAANTVVFDINSGTIQALALQTNGSAGPLTYFCRNNCGAITGTNGRYRFAITHAAGVNNQVTYHIPSNGEVTTTAGSPSYGTLADSFYAGNLYLGGRTGASLVGTVNAFEIYEGIVDSTTIAEFLGVS